MMRGTTLRSALVSAALALAIALAGCSPQQADYDPAIADLVQAEVLEVSQLSAEADFDAALLALAELEVSLKDARARGLLTEERYESVMAAMTMVRADLEAAIAAQAPPAPTPEPEGDDDDDNQGNGNKGKGNSNGNKDKGNGDDDD